MNIQTTEFRLEDGMGGDILTQIGENVRLWETYSPNYQAVKTSEQSLSRLVTQLIGQAIADNISTHTRYNIAAAYVARFSFESLKRRTINCPLA
jgi:hypothetical protein